MYVNSLELQELGDVVEEGEDDDEHDVTSAFTHITLQNHSIKVTKLKRHLTASQTRTLEFN